MTHKNPVEQDPGTLQRAICDIDAMAQEGFSEIEAIAKLAEKWLERPDSYRHLNVVSAALRAIWGKAQKSEECISNFADRLGCGHFDEGLQRVLAAERKAKEAANGR